MLAGSRIHRINLEPVRVERCRFRARPFAAAFLGALVAVGTLASQESQPKQEPAKDSGYVLRQTVRRVRVDVTVTDGQGNPVPGLQATDFRLSEDGKPQSIRHFEWQGGDARLAHAPTRPVLPPHMFMNLPERPESGPPTVLLYDLLNTPVESQPFARAQMVDFLKKHTGQQTAILVLSDRLHLVQGFTSDAELLQRAANQPGTMPQRLPLNAVAPSQTGLLADTMADQSAMVQQQLAANPHVPASAAAQAGADPALAVFAQIMTQMQKAEASDLLDRRVEITLDALKQIGRFMVGVPGRKNLIWYSGAFPAGILPDSENGLLMDDSGRNYTERVKAVTNLLNESETAVYPVDARGLETNSAYSASASGGPGGVHSTPQSGMRDLSRSGDQRNAEHTSMDVIAEQTGGRAFYNTNGLEQALAKAALDGTAYYSLVYAPTNDKFDGSVRRIGVALEHNHYHLAYRRTYFADDSATKADPHAPAAEEDADTGSMAAAAQFGAPPSHQLVFAAQVDAIGEPAPATDDQMTPLLPFMEQAAKAAHRKFEKPTTPVSLQKYVIQYSVLASQLDLRPSENSIYRPHLSLAALAFNKDGETLWGYHTHIEDAIPASAMSGIAKNGYQAVQMLLVPTGAVAFRLVVRDDRSGRLGSMEIPLPLSSDKISTVAAQGKDAMNH